MIEALWGALLLGIMTSISPCPLATNITAVSFIGQNGGKKKDLLLAGLLYSLGRSVTYILLGYLLLSGLFQSTKISLFLQKYMHQLLGPIFILVGLILLEWIGTGLSISLHSGKLQEKAANGSIWWAFPIGFLFALSFCPVSAGFFFAILIPQSIILNSAFMMPLSYGIGTAVPVLFFSFLLGFSANKISSIYGSLNKFYQWFRWIVGASCILGGIYMTLVYIYGVRF